jgi:hypothetical protein
MGLMPLGSQKNARHAGGQQLVDLQIVYMEVKTLPDYGRTPPERWFCKSTAAPSSELSFREAMVSLPPSSWPCG